MINAAFQSIFHECAIIFLISVHCIQVFCSLYVYLDSLRKIKKKSSSLSINFFFFKPTFIQKDLLPDLVEIPSGSREDGFQIAILISSASFLLGLDLGLH